MSRRLRYFEPGTLVEVTLRAFQQRLLLRPSPALREIILGVMGRAQAIYNLRIHPFVFLSNHYHLLCSPTDPQQLAAFMCYFNSNLAREIARLHNFPGRIWDRRYQAIPVSGEAAAQVARLKYLLSHGCKEGFVLTPAEWPGVHCLHELLEGKPLQGAWFDRSLEYEARRQGIAFGPRDFSTVETVHLTPIPCWQDLSSARYREHIAELVELIESETRQRQKETGRAATGARFVLRQHPHEFPHRSSKSPAPAFHAATRAARQALLEAYRAFLAAYRRAAQALRAGEHSVAFPQYCFPPPLPFSRGPGLLADG